MPRNSLEGSSSGRPRLEDKLAGVVAVHREVEQHLSSPADENGGCHDAPVRPQAKKYLEKKTDSAKSSNQAKFCPFQKASVIKLA